MLPDNRSEHVKSRVMQDIQQRRSTGLADAAIDIGSDVKYGRTELE